MIEPRDEAPVALALEHMTGPVRGSVTWLTSQSLDISLDAACLIHVADPEPDEAGPDVIAHLRRDGNSYEITASKGRAVWVNRQRIDSARLKHGDTIEFGQTGPLCRVRFFSDNTRAQNSAADILSDIGAYLRMSRQPPIKRTAIAVSALFGRLSHETGIFFKFTIVAAIIGFAVLAYQQKLLNERVQRDLQTATAQLDNVAAAMVKAQNEALKTRDLDELREEMELRVKSNVSRLEELEQRTTASSRVIAQSNSAVAFLQGVYGFREIDGDRMLRRVINPDGIPLLSPRGWPLLTLDGDGPVVKLEFTGTGFVVGDQGALITNRHVALPWEQNTGPDALPFEGVEPVMIKMLAYLPEDPNAVTVRLLLASGSADLAILQPESSSGSIRGLSLAETLPSSGDEVIVMGYPTGLRSMLAQSGTDFIAELQKSENTNFWTIAARLAENGYIAPLSSRGIVGQVTTSAIVYDAETTHGGSGGPVLDINGAVVAVNSAILPEFGGSNLGVPVAKVRILLENAAELAGN